MAENDNDDIVERRVLVTHTVQTEPPIPPPTGLSCIFKTICEWLSHVCDTNQPDKSISKYDFGLFISPGNYVLSLIGINTYHPNHDVTRHLIEFKPADMFFLLPPEYQKLSPEDVRELVLKELIEFTKTDKFRNSYLPKAEKIGVGYAGYIWPEVILL